MTCTSVLVFPPVPASIRLTCSDIAVHESLVTALTGEPLAVPTMEIRPALGHEETAGAFHIEAEGDESGYTVAFSGDVTTRSYRTSLGGLVADTCTVALTALQTVLLSRSEVAVHAAFADVDGAGVLIAGPSGSGKSSTAVAALAAGYDVYSGEISFVGDCHLALGESGLSVAVGAVERFGLTPTAGTRRRGGNLTLPLAPLPGRRAIDAVVFPRVGNVPTARRRVARREAEVQLFECVTSQAPIWRLVGGRTEHVKSPWDASASRNTIAQAFRLCDAPTWLIEGTPAGVVESIADLVAASR